MLRIDGHATICDWNGDTTALHVRLIQHEQPSDLEAFCPVWLAEMNRIQIGSNGCIGTRLSLTERMKLELELSEMEACIPFHPYVFLMNQTLYHSHRSYRNADQITTFEMDFYTTWTKMFPVPERSRWLCPVFPETTGGGDSGGRQHDLTRWVVVVCMY